jgi:GTPase
VADTVRCENPNTFISNMMYALSILYKTKLPLLVVFNKTDVIDHSFASKWMTDFQAFDDALAKQDNYLATLSRSMSLVLDEFYQQVPNVGVSAAVGKGFDHLLPKFDDLKKDYFEVFLPELQESSKPKPQSEEEK